jgi:DNA repair protein RadD
LNNSEKNPQRALQSRPYQTAAINEIKNHFRRGTKKVMLHMPTGSGKTFAFSEVLKGAYKKGNHAILVVKGRQLVDQASQRLCREGVPHGVFMANHYRYRPQEKIQVCSVDTVMRRKVFPQADIVVIDEAHMATSKSFVDFLAHYADKFFLAVSATPFSDKPIHHLASVVVKPITVNELVAQGYLAPLKYFAPRTPDLTGITDIGGDFDLDKLSKEMQKSLLVGDIVNEWKNKRQGTATLCFAVDVAHSKLICSAFQDNGISAVHVDAETSLDARKTHIDDLEAGRISVIVNCGVLTTGVDIPPLETIIIARPTKSYNLHIQILGRGTRISPGKDCCVILDHSGNTQRHGFINEERICGLEPIDKKEVRQSPITCKHCFGVFMFQDVAQKGICPLCGEMFTASELKKARELKQVDGELVEIKELTKDEQAMRDLREWKKERKAKGHRRGWLYWKCVTKYGPDMAARLIPKRNVPDWIKRK